MTIGQYLFASEHNDYKPWIITPPALAVFCLVIWALRFLVPATISLAAPGIDPTDLMNRINSERTQRFIPALQTNSKLTSAAGGKAQDMLARSYFAHVDPDGHYVWGRIEAAGYKPYATLGENLAMDFTSAAGVIQGWMNSPTHRQNLLNEKFEDQGLASLFGTYEPSHETNVQVSLFGTLYKTAKTNPPPPPAVKATPKPTPPPVAIKPSPAPTPTPTPAPARLVALQISKDIKIATTALSGRNLINVDVVIAGSPVLVTGRLKTQSITLLAGQVQGQFVGSFTFDSSEDLSNQTVSIEARDKNGAKTTQDFALNVPAPVGHQPVVTPKVEIPATSEGQVIKILRIIFGIFAAIYLGFLVIDAIIIHRAKIKRAGIHSNPHILVLFLIAAVSLFANWV